MHAAAAVAATAEIATPWSIDAGTLAIARHVSVHELLVGHSTQLNLLQELAQEATLAL